MARDMKAALEELEWNQPKSVHVLGFSFGGMIALQLGRVCPEYVASLHLVSTAAKFKAPKIKVVNAINTLALLKHNTDEKKAARVVDLLFTPEYLYAHNPDWPEFKNNRDRFLTEENISLLLAKDQNLFNVYTQALACARHELKTEKLWEIASKVKYIFVSSADEDNFISPECATTLMSGLNSQGRLYHGGHGIIWQYKDELNADQEALIQRAEKEYLDYPPPATLLISET